MSVKIAIVKSSCFGFAEPTELTISAADGRKRQHDANRCFTSFQLALLEKWTYLPPWLDA